MNDQTNHLKSLGSKETEYQYDEPDIKMIEMFPNQHPEQIYTVTLFTDEFTSLCPKTGQPDFAEITVSYVPDEVCIETKSFKLYMFAYRNYRSFMETITNKILFDLRTACEPRVMKIVSKFNKRGGIGLTIVADYFKPNEPPTDDTANKLPGGLHSNEMPILGRVSNDILRCFWSRLDTFSTYLWKKRRSIKSGINFQQIQ